MNNNYEIKLIPYDTCCFNILDGKTRIGMWCPVSTRVVVEGEIIGFAATKEDVINHLKLADVPRWVMVAA